jgi:hypothetical protein
VTVNVDVAVPFAAGVTDVGTTLQVTVAFTGAIAQESDTAALNPFNDATVIVDVVLLPAAVFADTGVALKAKSFTDTVKVVVRV